LRKDLSLDAYVPTMGETLVLDSHQVTRAPAAALPPEDLRKVMEGTIATLEKELEELKARISARGGTVHEADVDRLKDIEEDLRMTLPD
jgi:adenylate kinase